MTDHKRALILAAGAIDFDLAPVERTELERHLASCLDCRRTSHRLDAQAMGLRDRRRAIPPAGMRERVGDAWRPATRSRPGSGRYLLLVAAAVAVTTIGLTLAGISGYRSNETSPSPTVAPTFALPVIGEVGSLQSYTGLAEAVAPMCPVAAGSDCVTDIASGAGAIWVATKDGVLRFDPVTKTTVAKIHVGTLPHRLWFADGSLWVSVEDPGALVRIDPQTNKVAETIAIGGSPVGIVDAFGSIWVVDQTGDRVVRVDPPTESGGGKAAEPRRLTSIPVGIHAWGITTLNGSIWVTDRLSQTLLRVDPGLDRLVDTIDLTGKAAMCCAEGTPAKLAAGFGQIWITGSALKSYDPMTGVFKAYLTQVDPRVAIGKDSVWVAGSSNYVIQRLDPVTGKVTAQSTFPVTASGDFWSYEANVTETPDGHVWIGTDQGYRLIEVTPTP